MSRASQFVALLNNDKFFEWEFCDFSKSESIKTIQENYRNELKREKKQPDQLHLF